MADYSVSELKRILEYDEDFKDLEKKLEEERRKIDSEKKATERANRESESALRLAEERKKENDELCCKITKLQNDLKHHMDSASLWKIDKEKLCGKIADKNHEDDIKLAGEQKEENEKLRSRINEVEEKLENALKLAGEQEMEKEELRKSFTGLQKKLQSKKALKLAHEVIREFNDDGEFGSKDKMDGKVERENKTDAISRGSNEKDEYIEHLESLNNNILTVKELKSNDELQKARKELVNGFLDSQGYIGVKTLGTLDSKPFQAAIKRQYVAERAKMKPTAYRPTFARRTTKEEYEQVTKDEQAKIDKQAVDLCTLWEYYLRDASWHPFKVIRMGGDQKEVIDEEDEYLKTLREEHGNEVYEAVTTALIEMNDYNPSGCYPVRELWNFMEKRKATVNEGVSYLLKHWNLYKS